MPAGDGTGPMGMGPMTGKGAGYCADSTAPGFMNPMPGRGRGMGRGRGQGGGRRGWRHQFKATGQSFWARNPLPEGANSDATRVSLAEVDALKDQADRLEQTLQQIRQRIVELESGQAKES